MSRSDRGSRIAVITPHLAGNLSPLLPAQMARAATEWEWYHRCLSQVADVEYFAMGDWREVSGFDAVLVHEAIEATTNGATLLALSQLRSRNEQLIWVEPHQRSTFGGPVFERGFFDIVDRIAKYQLMRYDALVEGLSSPQSNLAPWAFYAHSSIASFYADSKLFALPTTRKTLARHLSADLSAFYGEQIVPMMRLFSLPRPDSWYGGSPSRQADIVKEAQVGIAVTDGQSASIRGLLAGLLAQGGLDVKVQWSRVRAAATSEACIALGPAHLDGGAADVLRFETLAVLPHDPRYLIWDDVFVAHQSYLPIEGFGELVRNGGRVIDGDVARQIAGRLADALSNPELRAQILAGQRRAYDQLCDPRFVAAKLGLECEAETAVAPTPAASPPRPMTTPTAPIRVGSISSDQISVVIQGAIGRDDLPEQVVESVRRHLPGCEVILSTWKGQRDLAVPVDQRVESEDPGAPWQVHEEWPANTNRLLRSTFAGLAACTRPYTLKLRSDTPIAGAGFLEVFQRYPERSAALRLLHDRIVVINFYCWNPDRRPFGLFSVADTVNFGRTDDLREVWDRPLDDEPANSIWFETHTRPDPDPAPWLAFRYTPEQLLWLGFLRKHLHVPFEHYSDDTPTSRLLGELSMANNAIVVDPAEFGVELPRFAGREPLEPDALYSHGMWHALYERYCMTAENAALNAVLGELALSRAVEDEGPTAREQRLERLNALAGEARAQATVPNPLEGARRFVVLADAEELLIREELLPAYADAMSGSKLVTLGIDASRLPAATAADQVRALVERCQLAERDDIDLLAVLGAQDELQRRRMLDRAHALYRHSSADPGELPVFTPRSLRELRALVEGTERPVARNRGR